MSPLTPEQAISVAHDPYKLVREKLEIEKTEVAPKYIQHFYACLRQCVKSAAFNRRKSPEAIVNEFRAKVEDCTNFKFIIQGEDILKDCDLIFADHQGPRGDGQKKCHGGKVIGIGGLECLIGIDTFPDKARIVLRHDLVSLGIGDILDSPTKALSHIVKAFAFRRNNPITVDRRAQRPPFNQEEAQRLRDMRKLRRFTDDHNSARRSFDWEEFIADVRAERSRVGDAMCDSVEAGVPVVVYPEGTRSPDGKILGFVSEYFESIVEKYLLPRLYDGRPMKIGLLVADTLRTFPDGVGKKVKAYDHPITMKGVLYDPKNIMDALRKTIAMKHRQKDKDGNVILEDDEIQKLGRMMLIEVRAQMERTLVEIVNATND